MLSVSEAICTPLVRSVASLRGFLRTGLAPAVRTSGGVSIAPFLNNCASAACVSADFELSWAFRALPAAQCEEKARHDRNNVPWLVDTLDELDVPVTWATVGHLFLEECTRRNGRPHPEMPRPPREVFWKGDWYRHDPCSNVEKDPLWYAPDLIHRICSARAEHEIGTHSFSHIDYSPSNSTTELVRRELEESVQCMEPFGLRARSHVFPFNRMGPEHLSVLGAGGITAVRWRDPSVRLSYPIRSEGGVYRLTESLNLRRPRFCGYAELAKTFLDHADKQHAAFHVWFHPSDQRELLENELVTVLGLLRDRRDAGRTWLTTMGELAAYCEAREETEIYAERGHGTLKVTLSSKFHEERYGATNLTLSMQDTVRSAMMVTSRDSQAQQIVPFIAGSATCLNVPHDAVRIELRVNVD